MKITAINIGPQMQAPAALSQATPVQNTYYTIINTTGKIRCIAIIVNVGTTGETLELAGTIDGIAFDVTGLAATAGANYGYRIYETAGSFNLIATSANPGGLTLPFIFECRQLLVQVRKTTANGTGTLLGKVIYALG